MVRILAISGSLRRDSHNTRLLRHLAEQAPPGTEIEIWEGLRSIPPYDQDDDLEPAPGPVAELRRSPPRTGCFSRRRSTTRRSRAC